MNTEHIPFNKPCLTGKELDYLQEVLQSRHLSSGGAFTRKCEHWLEQWTGAPRVLLTNSCTSALEMAAVLAGLEPGDEVIMPSFTFTSTANAMILRGAIPVFVDIQGKDLTLDAHQIRNAITAKTKAIVPVHYAGIACDMPLINAIAEEHGLIVIEDAAQGLMAHCGSKPLGACGHLAAYSFHATKHIISGEGGALVINDPSLIERAEIIHDKGTTRAQQRAGLIRQYTWVDYGMTAPPSELTAAVLLAQLESADTITRKRLDLWLRYWQSLLPLKEAGYINIPQPQTWQRHNAHMFWVIFRTPEAREKVIIALKKQQIDSALHFQPLHLSPAGKRFGKCSTTLENTEHFPSCLLRLPLWFELPDDIPQVVAAIISSTLPG